MTGREEKEKIVSHTSNDPSISGIPCAALNKLAETITSAWPIPLERANISSIDSLRAVRTVVPDEPIALQATVAQLQFLSHVPVAALSQTKQPVRGHWRGAMGSTWNEMW